LAAINTKVDVRSRQRIVRLRQTRSKEALLAGEQSAYRSHIKLMYGHHHQQPQKDCAYLTWLVWGTTPVDIALIPCESRGCLKPDQINLLSMYFL
jgi:hypothetical protein